MRNGKFQAWSHCAAASFLAIGTLIAANSAEVQTSAGLSTNGDGAEQQFTALSDELAVTESEAGTVQFATKLEEDGDLTGEAEFIPFASATPIRFNLGVPAYEPIDVMLRTAPRQVWLRLAGCRMLNTQLSVGVQLRPVCNIRSRATVVQQETGRPVQFELMADV